MRDNQPLVTVFMAVFNGEHYLTEAINSVLNQTFADFELLVIDDGSTDDSTAIIGKFNDPRIRLLRNDANIGIFKTRNRGIREARGRYFATLDADDIACPDRLDKQVRFMEDHPGCMVCGGMARFIDAQSKVTGNFVPPAGMNLLPAYLFFACCFINSATIIRTEIFRDYGYNDGFEIAEDYDLFNRIAERYPVANISDFVVYYRVHGSNITSRKVQAKLDGEYKVIRYNLQRIGIDANAQTVELHHLFISKRFALSAWGLKELEAHLLRLKEANIRTGVFRPSHFGAVLMWQWSLVMLYMGLKPKPLYMYVRSDLFKIRFLNGRFIGALFRR
jgi:glycosyltransferase involved in cell wall biosynthesis